jgi:hypothetical protein
MPRSHCAPILRSGLEQREARSLQRAETLHDSNKVFDELGIARSPWLRRSGTTKQDRATGKHDMYGRLAALKRVHSGCRVCNAPRLAGVPMSVGHVLHCVASVAANTLAAK